MKISQESQDIIKQMEDLATQQKEFQEKREAGEKDLLQYLYKDLIANLKDHAGKPFLLEIKGSYTRVIGYRIFGGHETMQESFSKIFIGVLKNPQTDEHYGNYPKFLDEKDLLTEQSYEVVSGDLASRVGAPLQKFNWQKGPSWALTDLFREQLPESLQKDSQIGGNHSTVTLVLGQEEIVRWLAEKLTDTIPVEVRHKIFAMSFMQ